MGSTHSFSDLQRTLAAQVGPLSDLPPGHRVGDQLCAPQGLQLRDEEATAV